MNTSTGQSKPIGIQKKEYHEAQQVRAEEDFKYHTNQRIQNLQFAIDVLNKSLHQSIADQGSNRIQYDLQINEVMKACMSSLKEFKNMIDHMNLMVEENKKITEQLVDQQKNNLSKSEFNERISLLENIIENIQKEKQSTKNDFKSWFERQNLEIQEKLKSQKEEILSIPSEIPNLRKLMDSKLELVELNGQNSVLRSSNNEKQIMLLERKIDNIYQLIKKLEIALQEGK